MQNLHGSAVDGICNLGVEFSSPALLFALEVRGVDRA